MTPQTMEQVLEFCLGKIEDDDMLTLHDMLDKAVPAKDMAADAAIKRRTKLATDCALRGYKVSQKRIAMDILADRDAILAMTPHMFRMEGGSKVGAVPEGQVKSRTKSRRMTEAERTESEKAFPHMFRKH